MSRFVASVTALAVIASIVCRSPREEHTIAAGIARSAAPDADGQRAAATPPRRARRHHRREPTPTPTAPARPTETATSPSTEAPLPTAAAVPTTGDDPLASPSPTRTAADEPPIATEDAVAASGAPPAPTASVAREGVADPSPTSAPTAVAAATATPTATERRGRALVLVVASADVAFGRVATDGEPDPAVDGVTSSVADGGAYYAREDAVRLVVTADRPWHGTCRAEGAGAARLEWRLADTANWSPVPTGATVSSDDNACFPRRPLGTTRFVYDLRLRVDGTTPAGPFAATIAFSVEN
jgi:hypothetical protein